jgi:predicted phage tail protein
LVVIQLSSTYSPAVSCFDVLAQADTSSAAIGKGRAELERAARARASPLEALAKAGRRHALAIYLGAIALLTGAFSAGVLAGAPAGGIHGWMLVLLGLAALLATSDARSTAASTTRSPTR